MSDKQPENLYTPADVKRVRESLYKEQEGKDALTGLPLDIKQAVTDHNHKTQYVRGVLHRQSNVVLGKIENLWVRYLKFWYSGTLSDFLRQAANYIEKEDDKRYVHPKWIQRVCTDFNKLSEASKKDVLADLGQPQGDNVNQRKQAFKKAILSKKFTYGDVRQIIQERMKE